MGDKEEIKESDELVKFREDLVDRISKRHYKLSDYLPMQQLNVLDASFTESENELSSSVAERMEEDKRDMMKLLAMSFKHRFTRKQLQTKTLPRRLRMKERSCGGGCRRITYRFWKVFYSSIFFYFTPFLAFFANSYFQIFVLLHPLHITNPTPAS